MVIILTEVLIQVKGEGMPNTRWGKLKRWLPEWKERWEKIKERDSLIHASGDSDWKSILWGDGTVIQ